MTEVWKDIPEWPGYQASSLGRVRRTQAGRLTAAGRVIGSTISGSYPAVDLKSGDGFRRVLVHRLVAAAFLGPCQPGLQVNHIDGDKANNAPGNLEYVTPAENNRHAVRTGLNPLQGEDNPAAKLSNAQVADLRARFAGGESRRALVAAFGITKSQLAGILSGRSRPTAGAPPLRHDSLSDQIVAFVRSQPSAVKAKAIIAHLDGKPAHKTHPQSDRADVVHVLLSRLVRDGRLERVRRGYYRCG